MDGFGLFGVVKETGVDDEGLAIFGSEYFPHPLYRDEGLTFYEAMGSRNLGLNSLNSWNPFEIYRGYKDMSNRLEKKGIEGNMVGEGIIQGGLIIFGKDGVARYAYEEKTGHEIPVEDVMSALDAVREGRDGMERPREL